MKLSFLSLLFFSLILNAQITLKVKAFPKSTEHIYMAGSLNGWNPKDENFKFKRNSEGDFEITLPEQQGKIEYKLTQGNWETAEGKKSGGSIENRSLNFTGSPQTLDLFVESWQVPVQKKSTATKNVKILSENFYMPQLQRNRRIWIYLPPDYETSGKKYPVMYLHDGQNLFDELTAYSDEWGIDETLNKMAASGKKVPIVVGIDNGGEKRIDELSPFNNPKYGGGNGENYIKFITETLKPYIDKNYRTKKCQKHTSLGGSSLGGLISVYGAAKHPRIFGKIIVFSPAFWFNSKELNQFLQNSDLNLKKQKYYIIQGAHEDEGMAEETQKIIEKLLQKKVKPQNIYFREHEDGKHNESYWRREFPAAFEWLNRKN